LVHLDHLKKKLRCTAAMENMIIECPEGGEAYGHVMDGAILEMLNNALWDFPISIPV
jgi:hypothetical protein